MKLIRGKRIGLLTNQTGINEKGAVRHRPASRQEGARRGRNLVQLFSPEHGMRGTEDRENIASGVDQQSGLPDVLAVRQQTMAPPDSMLR